MDELKAIFNLKLMYTVEKHNFITTCIYIYMDELKAIFNLKLMYAVQNTFYHY